MPDNRDRPRRPRRPDADTRRPPAKRPPRDGQRQERETGREAGRDSRADASRESKADRYNKDGARSGARRDDRNARPDRGERPYGKRPNGERSRSGPRRPDQRSAAPPRPGHPYGDKSAAPAPERSRDRAPERAAGRYNDDGGRYNRDGRAPYDRQDRQERPARAAEPRRARDIYPPHPEKRPARTGRRPGSGRGPAPPTSNPLRTDGQAGDRIAKLLARAGVASRRDVERMIEDGRVARHGEIITTPATLLTSLHGITVDGVPVKEPAPARLFLFHKPSGVLTAARDPQGRPTIYDVLARHDGGADGPLPRLVPVGRLDLNTEGLLLMTNDGELKRALELPSNGVERTYRARTFGDISQAQLEDLIDGIEVEGVRYGRIDANLERRTGRNQWVEMTLTEGKNREVRRVLEHLGLQVSRLIRTRYGPFLLDDLPVGAIGEIRRVDLITFRKSLKNQGGTDRSGGGEQP